MRAIIITLIFLLIFCCFTVSSGFSETFYVHSYELCDNVPISIELQAKEGILDKLFESGHIVFDDPMDSLKPEAVKDKEMKKLIACARDSGAHYLIEINLVSTTQKAGVNTKIDCSVSYALYDVYTKTLLRDWRTKKTDTMSAIEPFWFTLGESIADEITRFFSETAKNHK